MDSNSSGSSSFTPSSSKCDPSEPTALRLGGRIGRRRAPKACIQCHDRKVRCDVMASRDQTCTNCRLDGNRCLLREKASRRETRAPRTDIAKVIENDNLHDGGLCWPESFAFDVPGSSPNASGAPSFCSASRHSTSKEHAPASNLDVMFSHYGFLEDESSSHLAPDDYKFLKYKGCFHLPCRRALHEFVRAYFLYIHPALPLFDEHQVWDMLSLNPQNAGRRMPLFVLRCILFVSSSFVPAETLRTLGFRDHLQARNSLYQRAKLLYDFKTMSDPLSLAQGTLLLTYYVSEREPLANTIWLGTAIQYAMAANAHLYYCNNSVLPEQRMNRKRLWWCCLLRDRILPLGLRRPIQISKDSFDFSQAKLSVQDLEPEFENSMVYNGQTKRILAVILTAQIELAIELTDIISLVYPTSGHKTLDSLDCNALMEVPLRIQRHRQALENWSKRTQESILAQQLRLTPHKSVFLFYEMTRIYFQAARAALCQHETLVLQSFRNELTQLRMTELGCEMYSVVSGISESVGHLVRLDLTRYLPVSAMAYMVLPIILNCIDVEATTFFNHDNESKRRQLGLCEEVIDFCNSRYSGTPVILNAIKQLTADAKDQRGSQLAHSGASAALQQRAPRRIQDWLDMFVYRPRQYLRMILTLDMNLCTGRYPDATELPIRPLSEGSAGPVLSIAPALALPTLGELERVDVTSCENDSSTNTAAIEECEKHDFFDFGIADEPSRLGSKPWSGESVDEILEALLASSGVY